MAGGSMWTPYVSAGGGSIVGDLRVLHGVESPQLGNARDLLVWLPPSYEAARERRYPLLVMHDGQNLFDATTSSYGNEWQVDETLTALAVEGIEAIVVGVPHMQEARSSEYTAWPGPDGSGGNAQSYVAFLAETAIPLVRSTFRTVELPEATLVGGSSHGGFVSLYAMLERPDLFGRALVMSPAFWWGGADVFAWAAGRASGLGRIWMDAGDAESPEIPGRSEAYVADVLRMDALLRESGYGESQLRTTIEPGAGHDEGAWARRLPQALRFLLR